MENYLVNILSILPVTHNVNHYRVEKPAGYRFNPGQATEVSINIESLKEERRPFTFTSLPEDPHLEFTIKSYEHNGVTAALRKLKPGDQLIIRDVWGVIEYKGPGVFIAGGAGVTPFIAILRHLSRENKINGNRLIFSNKTSKDIICKEEFELMLGKNFINTLTAEQIPGYHFGRLDIDYIKENVSDFHQPFYVCGPDPFVAAITNALTGLGADPESVVFEK